MRMRKGKKKYAVLFAAAAVLVMILFGSCKKTEASQSPSVSSGPDLSGMTVIIGNWWGNYNPDTAVAGNADEERTLEYRRGIQEKYSVKIREELVYDYDFLVETAAASIMTNSPVASIMFTSPVQALALFKQNLLAPIASSYIDFSDPAEYNQDVRRALSFEGKSYGFAYEPNINNCEVVFFNKRLFREAGIDPELPYNMQRDGTWTWDAFLDLARRLTRDIDNDGVIDVYGTSTNFEFYFMEGVVGSNNANYVVKDSNDKFALDIGSPEFLEGMNFIRTLENENLLMPWTWDNWAYDLGAESFLSGRIAMFVGELWFNYSHIVNMNEDYGVVVFPKGPRAGRYRNFGGVNVLVIPAVFSPEEVEKILYANALFYGSEREDRNPDAWRANEYPYWRDMRSVDETIAILRDPVNIAVSYDAFVEGLDHNQISPLYWTPDNTPSQIVESFSTSWGAIIDEANR